jgi:outer membrane receptor for ferric coprogen and ferric-rhodotorulic acid
MSAYFALLAVAAASPLPAGVSGETPRADEIIVTGQRTERDDIYTVKAQTTSTRFPISQRETPQSISVVSRAQIEDFQLNDVNALLATVPGINVQAAETDRVYYSARGFDIQTFQIDGIGLPFAFEVQTGSIDTAIYDHIEVIKGAPGLLSSTGNPSAVVNFIRKRPLTTFQASANAQYGSFNDLRLDGDVSVPLTAEGNIRARAVGVLDDSDSYLDRYHLRRWTGYGIVEADLGPDTVLSAGYGHQDHQSRGAMWGALPIYYTDGTRIDLPRSANTGPDWAGWHVTDRQIFGDLTHHFGEDWTARLTVNRRAVSEDDELFYVYNNPSHAFPDGVDPALNDASGNVRAYPGAFRAETRSLTVDAYIAGKVSLFGRQHDVMVGVNRSAQNYVQTSGYDYTTIGAVPLTLTQIFDGSFPRPDFPTTFNTSFAESGDTTTKRETAYGLVRLNLAEPLKVMAGANVTHATSKGFSYGAFMNYDKTRVLPFIGATFDLTSNFSAYASYATIFNPQTQTTPERTLIEPVTGDNLEAGIKGEWLNGGLNASIAVFQARQKHLADAAGFDETIGETVYNPIDATSQGIELEFGGQIAPGLQATGGYTLMRVHDDDHQAVRTFVPRNTVRLNFTYSAPSFEALKLGASFQYQSKTYLEPAGILSTTGEQVRIVQKGYALLDLLARYNLTEHLSISANLKNVTNVKYLTALNYDQAYYGAPRTILGTVSVKF